MRGLEFRNHPAQARHPVTGAPLVDRDDVPVPLFPQQRGIYLDGFLIGYCGSKPGAPVTLIRRLPEAALEEIHRRVAEKFGEPKGVFQPPERLNEDQFDEDDVEPHLADLE